MVANVLQRLVDDIHGQVSELIHMEIEIEISQTADSGAYKVLV